MILDIALLTLGIIAIATGYNRGALATIFSIMQDVIRWLQLLLIFFRHRHVLKQ